MVLPGIHRTGPLGGTSHGGYPGRELDGGLTRAEPFPPPRGQDRGEADKKVRVGNTGGKVTPLEPSDLAAV